MKSYQALVSEQALPSAVAYVEVTKPNGDPDIGTAFHIGKGYFATARHVISNGNVIRSLGRNDMSQVTKFDSSGKPHKATTYGPFKHTNIENTFFHPDSIVDVAIIKIGGLINSGLGYPVNKLQPSVLLNKMPDELTEGELLLSEVLVFGFPKIPQASDANMFAFKSQISSTIDSYSDKKRHFVVSGMPRGGFSGGPVMLVSGPDKYYSYGVVQNSGTVVGIVGKSLRETKSSDDVSAELGFFSAISVSTIRETISHHGLSLEV